MTNLNEIEIIGRIDAEKESMISYYIIGFFLGLLSFFLLLTSPKPPDSVNYNNLKTDVERGAYKEGFRSSINRRRALALGIGCIFSLVGIAILYNI